jgi:sec-independent protein translocase protein TatC
VPDFQNYLSELQSKLIKILIAFAAGVAFGIIRNQWIITTLISIFNLKNINIVLVSPYQFINLAVSISILSGIIFAAPFLVYELLSFVRPALRDHEYKLIIRLLPLSLILFVSGFVFGARILQFVIDIYVKTSRSFNIGNLWDVEAFLTQIVTMGTSMGIVFQLPIVLTILLRLGIIQRSMLTSKRRYVYAALIIFDVLLPPTDILSLSLIFIPLAMLFEGTLLFNQERHLLPIANLRKSIKINQGGTTL